MNNEQQSLAVSAVSSSVCTLLAGLQVDEMLRYVNLALAVLSALVAIAFTIWKWWHEAKKDGKITTNEVDDVLDDVTGIIERTKESIGKIADDDKRKKEKKDNGKSKKH